MTWKNLVLPFLAAAAVAGCGTARDVPLAAEGGAACASCHGDASRSGPPLAAAAPADGPHDAHVQRTGIACSACHVVPTDAGHADGRIDVAFGSLARAGGAEPTYAGGTCSGVYCHGAFPNGAGAGATVSWRSTEPLGCASCHGAPPASHGAGVTGCAGCHPGTVSPDGTLVASGLHANGRVDGPTGGAAHADGWSDPSRHGPAAKGDLASCQSCHGVALDGGTAQVSCAGCHGGPAWISNCTFCHGTKLASYTQADLAEAAPPRGANGETAATARAVGAHERHLAGGGLGRPVACAECHALPTDLSHLDGAAAVTFGQAASRGATPTWNGATCASTYCHGRTVKGGTNKAPSWTGGAAEAACGTCHGAPPPAPHTQSTACGDCHAGYGTSTVNLAVHLNGIVERPAASGHPAGFAAREQHGFQANRGGLSSCKSCHGATLAGGAGPSCASCHGGTAWQTSCTFCHGSGAQPAPPVDTQGRTAATNVSVGVHAAHLGTSLMAAPACTECHPSRAGSNVATDAAHVDGDGVAEVTFGALARTGGAPAAYARASATAASCASTYCHGRFAGGANAGQGATMSWTSTAQVGCGSCHGAPPATGKHSKHVQDKGYGCATCHAGYGSSTVSQATHLNGAKDVSAGSGWSASGRSCANACHGSKRW